MADAAAAAAAAAKAAQQAEGEAFIKEVWGLTGTAILFVFLRYYARIKAVGFKGLTGDDYLMFPATVVMSIESMAGYFVVAYWQGFANNGINDEQRETLYNTATANPGGPEEQEMLLRIGGSKNHVLGLLMYATLMWLLKGCWVLYYNRLTDGVQDNRTLIRGSIIVIPGTYLGVLAVAFFKCVPFDHQWQIFPDPGRNCMPAVSPLQTIFVMIMNTVTDFYLMAIPIPMVWKSRLPPKKKFAIIFMFSGAFLEMTFGILRAVAILQDGDTNPAESGYWSIRESFVSFVLTNIPMVYPLFRDMFNRMRGKTGDTTASGYSNQSGRAYPLGSYPRRMADKSGSNSRSRDPHSLPTFDDSKEQIVTQSTERPPSERDVPAHDDDVSFELPKQQHPQHHAPAPRSPTTPTAPVIDSNRTIAERRRATRDLEAGIVPEYEQPQQHQRGASQDGRGIIGRSASRRRNGGGSRGTNQIVVTTEYTVSGAGASKEKGTGYAY